MEGRGVAYDEGGPEGRDLIKNHLCARLDAREIRFHP